ncbi:MAG: GAF domain-containing protein [Anaerolineae bacterium]|nr:GAF domain-containing protein [Anaerolineae bacterium]
MNDRIYLRRQLAAAEQRLQEMEARLHAAEAARSRAEDKQRALEKQRTFFHQVLDINPDFIFVRDGKGRFILANKAIADAYGTTVQNLIGKTDADFNSDEEEIAYIRRSDLEVINTSQEQFIPETPILRNNRWVQTVKRPLIDEEGNRYVLGVSSDITTRKVMELTIQASMERRGRQVQLITDVAQEIAAATALDDLFRRVVTLVKERFGYYHAQIFRYDPEAQVMRLVVGYGETGKAMVQAGHHLPLGRGVVGTATETGTAVLASDVQQDADWVPNAFLPETKGELAVPIKLRDEVLGILDVQSDTAGMLTGEDRLLLEGLCGQIALAIESKQKENDLAQERYLLHALLNTVPDHIYFKDAASRFIRVSAAMARWVEVDDPQQAVGKTDFDFFAEEHAAQAYADEMEIIQSGQPLVGLEEKETWPDGHETWVSTTKLPLQDDVGNIVGTLGISTDITERKLAESVRERLLTELEERAQQLQMALSETESLYRASRAINAATSPEEVLHALLEAIELPSASLFMLDVFSRPWEGEQIPEYVETIATWDDRVVGGNPPVITAGQRFELQSYPFVWQLRPDKPFIVEDVSTDSRLDEMARYLFQDTLLACTVVFLPMVVSGRWIGYFNLIVRQRTTFDEASLRRLMNLTGQAATVISSLRLVEQMQLRVADLTAVQETMSALMVAATFDEAVATLLPYLLNAVKADVASMFLVHEETMTRVGRYVKGQGRDLNVKKTVSLADYPLTQKVIDTRQAIAFKADDPLSQEHALQAFEATGITANATIPLVGREGVLGIFSVSLRTPNRTFDEHDMRILQTLANQAALSFENIRLLERTRARAAQERLVRTIIDRIRRGTSRDAIMQITLEELNIMLGASHSIMQLGIREQ